MCQHKIRVKVGSNISSSGYVTDKYGLVPCGSCEECVQVRRSQWCWRALVQTEHSDNSLFLTLTYDNEHLPVFGVDRRHVQLFFKRVRQNISLWYPEYDVKKFPLKYFLVSEYGSRTNRPHYHCIVWNCPLSSEEIERCWKNGFIYVGDCCNASVQYCLKYFAIKEKAPVGYLKNFCLMSKGIGKQWLSDNLYYVK